MNSDPRQARQTPTNPAQPLTAAALTVEQFKALAALAYERYGLNLPEKKRFMVSNRIMKLQRENGFDSVETLLAHYQRSTSKQDSLALFDVLSTNLTHFFRESQHFDVMLNEVVESARRSGEKRLRIWSAER